MKLAVFVPEMGTYPKGYGLAWMDMSRMGAICLPVPLNVVAGIVRKAWHRVRTGVGLMPSVLDSAYIDGWVCGRETARPHRTKRERHADFEDGYKHAFVVMLAQLDKKPIPPLPDYLR